MTRHIPPTENSNLFADHDDVPAMVIVDLASRQEAQRTGDIKGVESGLEGTSTTMWVFVVINGGGTDGR